MTPKPKKSIMKAKLSDSLRLIIIDFLDLDTLINNTSKLSKMDRSLIMNESGTNNEK